MTVQEMRVRLAAAYRAEKWRKKVAAMSDSQVIAVYHRMSKNNQL